jgi:hypothetical protein
LVIRRADPTDHIDRQVWLSFAVDSVALVLLVASQEQRDGIVFPAFGLYSHFDRPALFWKEGVVVVKYATDIDLADLRVIADRLRADLVP